MLIQTGITLTFLVYVNVKVAVITFKFMLKFTAINIELRK